jgi:septal ring factor EnvC (AmiA/AmiB activator)
MKLTEISAALTELRATLAGLLTNKEKATTEAIAAFQAKLTSLETGAASELATVQSELAATKASLESEQAKLAPISATLDAAIAALKLDVPLNSVPTAKIDALQSAVSATLAKLNVQPGTVPAPAAQQGAAASDVKTKSRADFEKLPAKAKMEFMRGGGRLTE